MTGTERSFVGCASGGRHRRRLGILVLCVTALAAALPSADAAPAAAPATKWGYVWAHSPTTASYTPGPPYSDNSLGGTNTVRWSGGGDYLVEMPLIGGGTQGGVAHVTAYGSGNSYCGLGPGAWAVYPSPPSVFVYVRCYDASGTPAPALFTASWARPRSGPFAHVLAYSFGGVYSGHSYNSAGGVNTVTRDGLGRYTVRLPKLGGPGGHVQVTAHLDPHRCAATNWKQSGTAEVISVRCFTAAGAPFDSNFALSFTRNRSLVGLTGGESGYGWANDATSASYTVPNPHRYNSLGGTVKVARSSVGRYGVTFTKMDTVGGQVTVTGASTGGGHCKVTSWGPGSPSKTVVGVACFDAAGAPKDHKFNVAYTHHP